VTSEAPVGNAYAGFFFVVLASPCIPARKRFLTGMRFTHGLQLGPSRRPDLAVFAGATIERLTAERAHIEAEIRVLSARGSNSV
jgi:hypothetical protein